MNRLVNLLLAVGLLILLLILIDPNARARASALVRTWDDKVIVNLPSMRVSTATPSSSIETPAPTVTPVPTEILDNDDEMIPNTGDEDSSDEPIIQVNWDALRDSLREFWDSIRNIKIDLNPADNR